jgi:cytochrome c biogenesis protein CcmG, thiol:disulfide interchange protein DsbE
MSETTPVTNELPLAPPESNPTEAQAGQPRAFTLWRTAILGLVILFIGFLGYRLFQTNTSEHRAAGMAPDFTFATFDGQVIALEELQGQGIVLNFWASWCDPCRDEAELLEQVWRREKENGILFLGLDYLDQEPAALKYLAEYDVTYPNGPDLRSEIARRYGIKGVPETFFIAPDGRIVDTVIGPLTNMADLNRRLDLIRPTQ